MSHYKTDGYFLATSDYNRIRLEVLNRVYNQVTLNFLINHEFRKGVSILVCECSSGFFAIELAKYLGNNGNVVSMVIDSDEDLLNNARENAKAQGVVNIEFKNCNIENMQDLEQKFDIIYGRWVLIFTYNISAILAQLTSHLKPNGSLICEELNFAESGHFSYPHEDSVDKYHEFALKNAINANLEQNTANLLLTEFQSQGLQNIQIKANQPVLTTSEEKSIYRLGLISMSDAIIKNNLCTKEELQTLIKKFSQIEYNGNIIIGCFRNFIVSGIK